MDNSAEEPGEGIAPSEPCLPMQIRHLVPGSNQLYQTVSQKVKTEKILVFVNLGYSKLDDGIAALASGSLAMTDGGGWTVDQTTGRIKPVAGLDLNGNDIIGAKSILSANGKWSIDEDGRLVAEEIQTKKLCLEDVCVGKEELKTLLQNAGLLQLNSSQDEPVTPSVPDDAADEGGDYETGGEESGSVEDSL